MHYLSHPCPKIWQNISRWSRLCKNVAKIGPPMTRSSDGLRLTQKKDTMYLGGASCPRSWIIVNHVELTAQQEACQSTDYWIREYRQPYQSATSVKIHFATSRLSVVIQSHGWQMTVMPYALPWEMSFPHPTFTYASSTSYRPYHAFHSVLWKLQDFIGFLKENEGKIGGLYGFLKEEKKAKLEDFLQFEEEWKAW